MLLEAVGRLRWCEESALDLGRMLRRPRAGGNETSVVRPLAFQEGAGGGSGAEY